MSLRVATMPVYEYFCPTCRSRFELLRRMSQMDEPATCPKGHEGAERVVSLFSSLTKGADGSVTSVAGTGGPCAGCAAGSCSTCSAV